MKLPYKENYHWCLLVLPITIITAVEIFFLFPLRIHSTVERLEHIRMLLFGKVEKLPLDLILPSVILHIIYNVKDERAKPHLKC